MNAPSLRCPLWRVPVLRHWSAELVTLLSLARLFVSRLWTPFAHISVSSCSHQDVVCSGVPYYVLIPFDQNFSWLLLCPLHQYYIFKHIYLPLFKFFFNFDRFVVFRSFHFNVLSFYLSSLYLTHFELYFYRRVSNDLFITRNP